MENIKEKRFQLETLTCPSCVTKIEGMLSKESGVKEAKVLFNSSKVKVKFETEKTSEEHLKSSLEKLGFPVIS
ncbi:MAG TPA: heavy-metal-associated domain-containing protein [Flavobacteriaceae bacterium]|nr:heavy-metal-associated domain-containing protein [Flavobacteriaceae bacterium]